MRDDADDVDRRVPDALDGGDNLQDRRHTFGFGWPSARHNAHRAHGMRRFVEALFEMQYLIGHTRVAEQDRCVGKVDHQFRRVLCVGQHRSEAFSSVVHGVTTG